MAKDSSSEKKGASETNQEENLSSDEEYSDDDSDYSSDDDEEEEQEGEDWTPEEREEAEKRRRERRRQRHDEAAEKEQEEEDDDDVVEEDDLWNFPIDREHWTEEDLGEVWADNWAESSAVGYDPELVDDEDVERFEDLRRKGKGPPDTPFYVPYRKFYPPIPDNHYDIRSAEDVVEELERTEEFLVWSSYVFKDGSCYEGTVWDDLAHGKGVYTTPLDLCRYEGEWFQNMMQGHGVLEVDLPVQEPLPDTEEARKLKKEGVVLKSDYMDPFDKEWIKTDIEEIARKYGGRHSAFEDSEEWVKFFGEKPEKGHYKYSGQWKHSRMHGCGVYEINGRLIWGKFYFGELLPDTEECTAEMSAFHSSLADVAAAKAKMFINKPDGMVREMKGPYNDPSHPYMYEEEDLWMAPGFINSYYKVPEEWGAYVEDLDNEREMWLNSFYKTTLTIPMPPELEHWWSKGDEFVVLGNTPTSTLDLNPDNVGRSDENLQGEVLLHVPTGRIINWAHDSKGQLRFFFQPITKNGEVKPEAIIPLPLGFDDYLEDATDQKVQAARKKRNIFQKFGEKWKKSAQKRAEEYHQKMEELENRWKREDQVMEERRRLKEEDRRVAVEMEEEERYARYLEILEESGVGIEEVAGGQSEELPQEQLKDRAGASSKEAEQVKTKLDMKEPPGGPDEEDEEDEDDKKPRSFGKVAMLDVEDKTCVQEKTDKPTKCGPISPTAFASLSIAHKVVGSRFCQAMSGLAPKLEALQCRRGSHIKQTSDGQAKSTSVVAKKGFNHVTVSSRRENLRLRAFCSSQQHTGKDLTRYAFKNAMKAVSLHGMSSRKQGRANWRCGRACSLSRVSSCRQDGGPNGFWSKPQFGCLSMALPVEM